MTQAQKHEQVKLVRLRVVEKKYMEALDKNGKVRIVQAPWKNNVVKYNKKKYGPGDEFDCEPKFVDALISSGGVQKANEKPKVFRPPYLDHSIELNNGIVLRDNVVGKVPTREGAADKDAAWVDIEDDEMEE